MKMEELNALLEETGETPCMSAPDIFFIDRGEKGSRLEDAKKLCGLCPIRLECADYAITNRERFGIWGGLTWNERKRFIRTNTDG